MEKLLEEYILNSNKKFIRVTVYNYKIYTCECIVDCCWKTEEYEESGDREINIWDLMAFLNNKLNLNLNK